MNKDFKKESFYDFIVKSLRNESLLERMLSFVLRKKGLKKDVACQYGGFDSHMAKLDQKLLEVEKSHFDRYQSSYKQYSESLGPKLDRMRQRMKKEMEVEYEQKIKNLRQVEMRKLREEEMMKFERKLTELRVMMEKRVKRKLKDVRIKEWKLQEMTEDSMMKIAGKKYQMEQMLRKQMEGVEDQARRLKDKKTLEILNFKTMGLKLDAQERRAEDALDYAEVVDWMKESKNERITRNLKTERENLQDRLTRQLDFVKGVEEKNKLLEIKTKDLEEKLDYYTKSLALRNNELDTISASLRKEKQANLDLQEIFDNQLCVHNKKEILLRNYERKMNGLVAQNVQLKGMLHDLRKGNEMMNEKAKKVMALADLDERAEAAKFTTIL